MSSERFVDFVKGLNDPQVRALSSQSGIQGWVSTNTDKLREQLVSSKEAESIFEKNHG